MNENEAKTICRRSPCRIVQFTENNFIRIYPNFRRIDSSNFNPALFWPFGIQLVALNFQTPDLAMQLNNAMFRPSHSVCEGYVLKPAMMWDSKHPLYQNFTPWDRDFKSSAPMSLSIHIISGQFLNDIHHNFNYSVEIEINGLHCDYNKQKTRNSFKKGPNPMWLEAFNFDLKFSEMLDLTFVRFSIFEESNSSSPIAQRVIKLKWLRQGFRWIHLHDMVDRTFEISSLFIFTRLEQGISIANIANLPTRRISAVTIPPSPKRSGVPTCYLLPKPLPVSPTIAVHGLTDNQSFLRVHIDINSTSGSAIESVLEIGKCAFPDFKFTGPFELLEFTQHGWNPLFLEADVESRVLSDCEVIIKKQHDWTQSTKRYQIRLVDDFDNQPIYQGELLNFSIEVKSWLFRTSENSLMRTITNLSTAEDVMKDIEDLIKTPDGNTYQLVYIGKSRQHSFYPKENVYLAMFNCDRNVDLSRPATFSLKWQLGRKGSSEQGGSDSVTPKSSIGTMISTVKSFGNLLQSQSGVSDSLSVVSRSPLHLRRLSKV